MNFADALRIAMKLSGISAADIARRTDHAITEPYLSRLFSGKVKDPSWSKACLIIDALNMTVDEFARLQNNDSLLDVVTEI